MKMIIASFLTTVLIVAMTLGAMFVLVRATEYVTSLDSPLQRAAAMGAELLLGVVLLLGTVWLATHLAVRIFAPKESASVWNPWTGQRLFGKPKVSRAVSPARFVPAVTIWC